MSLDMRVVIFSVFLFSLAASGFVPKEPTKQDIDIARIESFKLRKPSYKIISNEDTTTPIYDEGDNLGESI